MILDEVKKRAIEFWSIVWCGEQIRNHGHSTTDNQHLSFYLNLNFTIIS